MGCVSSPTVAVSRTAGPPEGSTNHSSALSSVSTSSTRLAAKTIQRLRAITLEDLQAAVGVVAQFEIGPGGNFVQVDATENFDPDKGVRYTASGVQLGLTESEIRNIHRRVTQLVEWVDGGRYETF